LKCDPSPALTVEALAAALLGLSATDRAKLVVALLTGKGKEKPAVADPKDPLAGSTNLPGG
jgi:hypothetical protein